MMKIIVLAVIGLLVSREISTFEIDAANSNPFLINDIDATLECNSTVMSIKFNLTKLNLHNRPFKIYFFNQANNSSCMAYHNSTENISNNNNTISLQAQYNECGIEVYQKNGEIVYNQTVVIKYGENPQSSLVYREENTEFPFQCTKTNNITVNLVGNHFNVTSLEKQIYHKAVNTSFDIELIRTTSGDYSTKDVSGQMSLGDNMYFKIVIDSVRSDLMVSPQNCYATNAANPSQKYFLIENRCANKDDKTVRFSKAISTNSQFVWENQAFRFFGASDAVYVTCDVLVCTTSNTMAACQRCQSSKRRRRDVSEQTEAVESTTLQTPVFLLVQRNQDQEMSDDREFFNGTKGVVIVLLICALLLTFVFIIVQKKIQNGKQHCESVQCKGTDC